MNEKRTLNEKKKRRIGRVRAKVSGTKDCPRLAVFRSNKAIYAQLIDDKEGKTIASVSIKDLSETEKKKSKIEQAGLLGEYIAKKAKTAGIGNAVFDRRSCRYHGRVRSLAEGARKSGLVL